MSAQASESLVTISTGTIRGRRAASGVAAFLGIPYAAPPVGANRLLPPQPVEAWSGVRDATEYGPTAPKGDYAPFIRAILPEVTVPGDEWLNLNVWTPSVDASAALPVLVFIHGGSFVNGSGSLPEYEGTAFARDGVVCVTINYRLGAEGFAALEGATPNRGLLDQVAALEWVRDTIAVFGGDPARVTVVGESAGAMSIGALLAMPAARGLFSGAILESGAADDVLTLDAAAVVARLLGELVGAEPTRDAFAAVPSADLAHAVENVALALRDPARAKELGAAAARGLAFSPVVDGTILPVAPLVALADGAGAGIPVLIGTTRDEGRLFIVPSGIAAALSDPQLEAMTAALGLTTDGLAVYRANRPESTPGLVYSDVFSDFRFRLGAIRMAAARESVGATTWMYRWDGLEPGDNAGLGSCHAAEIPFVFDRIGLAGHELLIGAHPSAALAATTHGVWVDFVKTGAAGWAPYDEQRRATALISEHIDVVDDPAGDEREAWTKQFAASGIR